MVNSVCMMMQRNEILLEPWIMYHGTLFGFENLYIYDNGSDSVIIRDTLLRYSKVGVNVVWKYNKTEDFKNKGEIFKTLIGKLQLKKSYNYYFPLDCDEFVMLSGQGGFSTSRKEIYSYLESNMDDDRIRTVNYQLINIPGKLDTFALIDFAKCVIPNRPLHYLDHGYHAACLENQTETVKSQLIYAHLHNKPFSVLLQSARQKLAPFVDCNDIEALKAYNGNGVHLVRYLLQSEEMYHTAYSTSTRVFDGKLLHLFDTLRLSDFIRLWSMEINDADMPYKTASCIVEGRYNRSSYLQKNMDVAESGMDPLVHYCMFGFNEGRPV